MLQLKWGDQGKVGDGCKAVGGNEAGITGYL